jgi:hypothetical protein
MAAWFRDHVAHGLEWAFPSAVPADWGDPPVPSVADKEEAERYAQQVHINRRVIDNYMAGYFAYPVEAKVLWMNSAAILQCMQTKACMVAMNMDRRAEYVADKRFHLPKHLFNPTQRTCMLFATLEEEPWQEHTDSSMAAAISAAWAALDGMAACAFRQPFSRVQVLVQLMNSGDKAAHYLAEAAQALDEADSDHTVVIPIEAWHKQVRWMKDRSAGHVRPDELAQLPPEWRAPNMVDEVASQYSEILEDCCYDLRNYLNTHFKHPRTDESKALWLTFRASWCVMQTVALRRAMRLDGLDTYDAEKQLLLPAYVLKPSPSTALAFYHEADTPWAGRSGAEMTRQIRATCDAAQREQQDTYQLRLSRVTVLRSILRYGRLASHYLHEAEAALRSDRVPIHIAEEWADELQHCMDMSVQHVSAVERQKLPEQWHEVPRFERGRVPQKTTRHKKRVSVFEA